MLRVLALNSNVKPSTRFAFPIHFARSIARAVLAEWVDILEEKMAGAGAPEGLPLNFRFSPDLSGPDSPTLQ